MNGKSSRITRGAHSNARGNLPPEVDLRKLTSGNALSENIKRQQPLNERDCAQIIEIFYDRWCVFVNIAQENTA